MRECDVVQENSSIPSIRRIGLGKDLNAYFSALDGAVLEVNGADAVGTIIGDQFKGNVGSDDVEGSPALEMGVSNSG